ncbi:MAG: hypothetical protein KZQ78_07660, partial [Candidatus Thiodiazotropha sp. (ex Ustalcina ferruginea)]|nr:hypothetical protein [Candidatus Thiodiazotropha sp. (ex Ustalcina ferruginea)]
SSNSLKSLRMVTFLQRTFTSLVHTHAGRTQPGEGIFIGEPLATPFDRVAIEQTDQQTRLITRNIKPGLYQLTHAVSPAGPFRKLTNILVKYHQKQLILPKMKDGYYQLNLSR